MILTTGHFEVGQRRTNGRLSRVRASDGRRDRQAVDRLPHNGVMVWYPDGRVEDVSPSPGSGWYSMPCIHPDGGSVVFHSAQQDFSRVWKVELATGARTPLTDPNWVSFQASYSWDGRHIVCCCTESPQASDTIENVIASTTQQVRDFRYWVCPTIPSSIFVMKGDGTGRRRLPLQFPPQYRKTISINRSPFNQALGCNREIFANF